MFYHDFHFGLGTTTVYTPLPRGRAAPRGRSWLAVLKCAGGSERQAAQRQQPRQETHVRGRFADLHELIHLVKLGKVLPARISVADRHDLAAVRLFAQRPSLIGETATTTLALPGRGRGFGSDSQFSPPRGPSGRRYSASARPRRGSSKEFSQIPRKRVVGVGQFR